MNQKMSKLISWILITLASLLLGFQIKDKLIINMGGMHEMATNNPGAFVFGKVLGFAISVLITTAIVYYFTMKCYQIGTKKNSAILRTILLWAIWGAVALVGIVGMHLN